MFNKLPLTLKVLFVCLFVCLFAGEHDRSKDEGEQEIGVSVIHIHKKAMTEGFGNDLAIMKLSRPAILNEKVKPVCLPKRKSRVPVGTKCYITGKDRLAFEILRGRLQQQQQQQQLAAIVNVVVIVYSISASLSSARAAAAA